jgi:hypothetical protein
MASAFVRPLTSCLLAQYAEVTTLVGSTRMVLQPLPWTPAALDSGAAALLSKTGLMKSWLAAQGYALDHESSCLDASCAPSTRECSLAQQMSG